MTSDATAHLQALGFTEYEARAYVTLLQQGALTGYQLAKASRIPRPNIYPVLDKLQQRGAATKVEVKGGVLYTATPPKELLHRLSRSVEGHLEAAGEALRDVMVATPLEFVRNVQGYDSAMARAETLVDGARKRLIAGVCAAESKRLSPAWERIMARGIEPVILCVQGCPQPCGHCEGKVYRYGVGQEVGSRWLIVVADDRDLLVAQLNPDGSAMAASTTAEVVVGMANHFLRNTIAAAELVRSLGPSLAKTMDGAALEALTGAGLASPEGRSWLTWAIEATKATSA